MLKPRCGMAENITRILQKKQNKKDKKDEKDKKDKKDGNSRRRRFVQQGSSWKPLFQKIGKVRL